MSRPTASPPVRLMCAVLALVAGLAAAPVVLTGELRGRGGPAQLHGVARVAVGGVLVALTCASTWVAVTGRDSL